MVLAKAGEACKEQSLSPTGQVEEFFLLSLEQKEAM